jgi:hypothetical protein
MNIDTELEITMLREQLAIARIESAELRARLGGDSVSANSWMQRKCLAQAKALTRLNERVTNQRFTLRSIERLGRGLSIEELHTAQELEGRTVVAVA